MLHVTSFTILGLWLCIPQSSQAAQISRSFNGIDGLDSTSDNKMVDWISALKRFEENNDLDSTMGGLHDGLISWRKRFGESTAMDNPIGTINHNMINWKSNFNNNQFGSSRGMDRHIGDKYQQMVNWQSRFNKRFGSSSGMDHQEGGKSSMMDWSSRAKENSLFTDLLQYAQDQNIVKRFDGGLSYSGWLSRFRRPGRMDNRAHASSLLDSVQDPYSHIGHMVNWNNGFRKKKREGTATEATSMSIR